MLDRHVNEAFRLLNKSIIRVEQPDVHLDDEDEVDEPRPLPEEDDEAADTGKTTGQAKLSVQVINSKTD